MFEKKFARTQRAHEDDPLICKANKCPTQSCCWCKPDTSVSWHSISNKSRRVYSVTTLPSKRVWRKTTWRTSIADPWSDKVDGKPTDTTWLYIVVSDTVRGPERRLRYERRGTRTGCAVILTAPTPALTTKRSGSILCYSLTGANSSSKSVSVTFFPFKRLKSDTSRSHKSLMINMINSNAEFLQGNCKTIKSGQCVWSVTFELRGRHRQRCCRSSICRRQRRHRWPRSVSSPQILRSVEFTHAELNPERSWSDGWADKTQARFENKGKPPCRNVFENQICSFQLTLSGSMREQTPKLMQPSSSLALQRKHGIIVF